MIIDMIIIKILEIIVEMNKINEPAIEMIKILEL